MVEIFYLALRAIIDFFKIYIIHLSIKKNLQLDIPFYTKNISTKCIKWEIRYVILVHYSKKLRKI